MLQQVTVKTILNKTKRRDPWFLDDYTVNPNLGCSFNCLFCYIRGSKYGIHMEEKLRVKSNAAELLDKALYNRAKKGQYGIIVLSSSTDPYLQFEKELGHTRQLLEIIQRHRFPLHLITRSDLVLRDLDLLQKIREQAILPADLSGKVPQPLFVTFSFSTIDDQTAHIFEPGATPPSHRIEAMKTVLASGFHSGVSLMPLIPWISDTGEHLEKMYALFAAAGVNYLFPASISLFGEEPYNSKMLMFRAIEKHYPHLLEKYHRYFDRSDSVPAFYAKALQQKTSELNRQYGIPDRIAKID